MLIGGQGLRLLVGSSAAGDYIGCVQVAAISQKEREPSPVGLAQDPLRYDQQQAQGA
jgi:hypothetical protein